MKLDTDELLDEAKRYDRRVKVINKFTNDFEADGIILSFDNDAISILEYSIGVVHFLRENVDVYEWDEMIQ